ncbi:hypothetical protein [Pseudoalteromonas aliena]|uniref:hypothetical protein n=1 Tax=Pseudoalteromonas aliena TaxID=247523 RepID=UPI0012F96120|nr:hypothetical protein [Pseudoalteromonas aliena]
MFLIGNLPLIVNQIPGKPKAKKKNIALTIDGSDFLLESKSPCPNAVLSGKLQLAKISEARTKSQL